MAKYVQFLNTLINTENINQINFEKINKDIDELYHPIKVILVYNSCIINIDVDLANKSHKYQTIELIKDLLFITDECAENLLNDILDKDNQTTLNKNN